MLVFDGFGHERDSQDEDTRDNKQDDGEVEVVHSAYDGGTVTGVNAAACAICKLGYHPGQADQKANHEAIKSTLREENRRKTFSVCISLLLYVHRLSLRVLAS